MRVRASPNVQVSDLYVFTFRRRAGDGMEDDDDMEEEEEADAVEVIVSRSTPGLRKRLRDADVPFDTPLNPALTDDDDDLL